MPPFLLCEFFLDVTEHMKLLEGLGDLNWPAIIVHLQICSAHFIIAMYGASVGRVVLASSHIFDKYLTVEHMWVRGLLLAALLAKLQESLQPSLLWTCD